MLASGMYLFNAFCAIVPCSVTQPPTQGFIWDGVSSTTTQSPIYIANLDANVNTNANDRNASDSNREDLVFEFSSDELQLNGRSKRLLDGRKSNRANNAKPYSQNQQRRSRMTGGGGSDSISVPIVAAPTTTQRRGQQSGVRSPMLSGLFSAVPVIHVLLNNLDNLMRSMNTGGDNGDEIHRRGRHSSPRIEPPLVRTQYGYLEGYFMGTMKGRRIAAFEGVPFAEPPEGKYRFRAPVQKFPWKRVLHAKKTGSSCLQAHPLDFFRVTGSEDCLYLNVYTPQIGVGSTSTFQQFPILFVIHGGSFQYGSSSEYGPSYMLDEDVILVTANYRLGPLGFMSTGDSESPGNYGLKDQALALKWVYENIGEFGGDNSRITIMGQSSGAVSAHLHLIANKTTPYFQNGVGLSGSAFGFWPIVGKKRSIELTRKLASALNCPSRSNSKALVRCLRFANPHLITLAQMQLYEWIPFHPLVLFAPVIEEKSPDAFLTKRPEEAYLAGEVMNKPWIFGQTSQEGHFDIYFMKLMMQSAGIALNGRKYLPLILDYTRNRRPSEITEKILRYYGGALLGRGVNMNSISDMYTDRYYTSTIRKAIQAHSAIAPESTYAYVFDYKGKYNLGSLFGSPESEWGVSHTEDMFYYFNSSVYHHGLQRDDPEYGLSKIMTDFLANFVTTGTPMHIMDANNTEVPFWDPVIQKDEPIQYLRIQRDLSMMDDPFLKRVQFWESLGLDSLL